MYPGTFALLRRAGGLPFLYFVEDIFGRPAQGVDVPLSWEIALDGGSFNPMTILPDNSLSVIFPPGHHTFQVRTTGVPQYHQEDGYYQLQLEQCLTPQL